MRRALLIEKFKELAIEAMSGRPRMADIVANVGEKVQEHHAPMLLANGRSDRDREGQQDQGGKNNADKTEQERSQHVARRSHEEISEIKAKQRIN